MLPAVREYTVSLHAQTNKIVTDRLSHTCSQLYTDVATSRHTYLILLCLNECTYTQKHTLDSQTMKSNGGGGSPPYHHSCSILCGAPSLFCLLNAALSPS